MNKLSFIALSSVFLAGAALAQGPLDENITVHSDVQGKTRAEVRAELEQARRDGSIRVSSIAYNPLTETRSLKSRDEVRSELIAARLSGEMQDFSGEDSGSIALSRDQRKVRVAAPILAGSPRNPQ
jgi:hypothetical protein